MWSSDPSSAVMVWPLTSITALLTGALHVVDHRIRLIPWHERPIGFVRSIDEGFARERHSISRGRVIHLATGGSQEGERSLDFANCRDDRRRCVAVSSSAIVESAMRLHVRELRAFGPANFAQRADLIDDVT